MPAKKPSSSRKPQAEPGGSVAAEPAPVISPAVLKELSAAAAEAFAGGPLAGLIAAAVAKALAEAHEIASGAALKTLVSALGLGSSAAAKPAAVAEAIAQAETSAISAALPASAPPVPRLAASSVFAASPPRIATRTSYALGKLRQAHRGVHTAMDPRLQLAAARAKLGLPRSAQASAVANELPVVARVQNAAAWVAVSEVRAGQFIGKTENGDSIVTGRIPASRVEAVRAQTGIVSLKAAQAVHPTLAATIAETKMRVDLLPPGTDPKGGAGVVIGIVDFGCDFAHENFRRADGRTRLEAIWHQAGTADANSPHGYGRVYNSANIDAALQAADPYTALGYGPLADSQGQHGTHGTHVMDIAAGNGRGTGVPGCAPEATLIFVDLSADVPADGKDAIGKSFGDSVRLLEAVQYIFAAAGDRPCVVNLSLGTNGGPHDGSTPAELGMDALLREKPNRAIVIAASNSFSDGIHAGGEAPAGGSADLVWVQTRDYEPVEMDLWIPGAARAAVELIAPDGTSVGLIEPGDSHEFVDNNQLLVFIANRLNDPNNHDNNIGIFIAGAFEAGDWKVRLHARGAGAAPFHAWIERYDSAQSSFAPPQDNSHTLGSISCGRQTIVVGSYDAHKEGAPISWYSSAGPTRDGREKPEVSAPGQNVVAAWSRSVKKATLKSGTSMASPAVAGLIALMFAEARRKGKDLTIENLRALLAAHVAQIPPAVGAWESQYGRGRINSAVLPFV